MPRRASAHDVVEAVRALQPGLRFVGIDGFGASGKTTLAATVAAAVPGVTVVHVDDFSGPGVAEWDWNRFGDQLAVPLRAGRPARYQRWAWAADVGGEWVDVTPGCVVVVEGVSATRREVAIDWDLTVWVEAPRELRLHRAVERDGPAMVSRWLDEWMPSEQAYADRERPAERVDLVVPGSNAESN